TAGLRPRPGLSCYNATKGAVHIFSKTLAVELAPEIRVCTIAPVAGEIPLLPTFMGGDTAELRAKFTATVPLGRLSTPHNLSLSLMVDGGARGSRRPGCGKPPGITAEGSGPRRAHRGCGALRRRRRAARRRSGAA